MKNAYIMSLLFMFFVADVSVASEQCLGLEKVAIEDITTGRFSHCKKGDIISVYVMSLKEAKNTPSLHHVDYFSLRADELKSVCSFEHPIVFAGQTELESTVIRWFDCVFIGKERDARFDPTTQRMLNEIKK